MSGIGFGMLDHHSRWWNAGSARFGWRHGLCSFWRSRSCWLVGPLNAFRPPRPQDMNLLPDGDAGAGRGCRQPAHRDHAAHSDRGCGGPRIVDAPKALRTRRFWFLDLAFFCLAFADQGMLLHGISVMVDEGLTRESAAFSSAFWALPARPAKS
jgi:hypothetical protein